MGTSVLSNGLVEVFQFKFESEFLKTVLVGLKTATTKALRRIEKSEFVNLADAHNLNSAIATPILFHNKLLGFISCFYKHSRTFSDFEHYQLESAAQQLGAVIVLLSQYAQHQLDDLRSALKIMERISTSEDDQAVRDRLVSETKVFLNADYCFISVPDDTGHKLIPNARTWSGASMFQSLKSPGGQKMESRASSLILGSSICQTMSRKIPITRT